MSIPGQMSLGSTAVELPLIYIAAPLSHLADEEVGLVASWCDAVDKSAVEAALTDSPTWMVRVHAPSQWSAPWNEGAMTPSEVYRLNSSTVSEAAALILVGYGGGSLGVGQEFGWATGLRIPVLYLGWQDEPVSRQLAGTPADITIETFANERELRQHVAGFVRSRRQTIEKHPKRLRDRTSAMSNLRDALNEAWSRMGVESRGSATAESRLKEARIEDLLASPHALMAASMDEISALAGSLGVDFAREVSGQPMPELEPREVSALRLAARENAWTGDTVVDLWTAARLERLRPGIRRFRLHSPEAWERFLELLDGNS